MDRLDRVPLLLAIDVGNTSVSVGVFRGARLLRKGRMPTKAALGRGGLGARLAGCVGGARGSFAAAVFASVVPSLDRKLAAAVSGRFRCPVTALTPASPVGMRLRVKAPGEVGADRIANALAARELLGAPAVVVDIGTAATLDCVNGRGEYVGGSIMPGPGMAASALRERTAKLPYVEPGRAFRAVGTDTAGCIRAGLYFGFLGMVRGMVESTVRELNGPKGVKLAVTGGYAGLYGRGLGPEFCIMPDLTLQGLRLAYEVLSGGGMR